MISLDGLPEPPKHDGWWDPATLASYICMALPDFRHRALEMKAEGATREDWEFLAELSKAIALKAWDEIEKGG